MPERIQPAGRQAARRRRCWSTFRSWSRRIMPLVPDPAVAGAARRVRHLGASRLGVRRRRSTKRTSWRSARPSASTASARHRRAAVPGHGHARAVEPAFASALEVLAANGVDVDDRRRTTTTRRRRSISHAILTYNRGRRRGLADGIVITPSHNPPDDGGFKYNPPNGGPADTDVTGWIEARANALLDGALHGVKRMPYRARAARRDHPPARLHRRLCRRPRQRASTWRRSAAPASASASIRWAAPACTTGRRSPSATARPDRGERRRRSDVPLHDRRLGRQDPHGPLLAVRDARLDRR